MSRAEDYIRENTKEASNATFFEPDEISYKDDNYYSWLTPNEARIAVEIAREEMIEKAIGWIEEINNHHHIMRYSDSCEPSLGELTEWFKNYMKEGGKDE